MDIKQALSEKRALGTQLSASLIQLEGDIQPDQDEEFFRLYPNPSKKTIYYLIPVSSVTTEIHKWTTEELSAGGFIGQDRYRILLPVGSIVQLVSITHHRMGENTKKSPSAEKSSRCSCLGPDEGCVGPSPCADDCGYCSNCCIG